MRIRNRVTIAAIAFAPLVVLGSPARAAGAGPISFQGHVTLPTFPCPGGPGCTATFNASLVGGAGTEISTGSAAALVTGLSATVNYMEVCTAGEALTGLATGTATLTGTNLVGDLLPATVPFSWTRVGNVAVIFSNPITNTSPEVAGAALFVPTGGLPVCTGGSTSATIAGKAQVCFFTADGAACLYTRETDTR